MPGSAVKVLLVEDSRTDAIIVRRTLENAPRSTFDVTWVETLGEALDHLARQDYDLLILDLTLPDSRGMESFSRVSRVAGDAAILVLSGDQDEDLAVDIVHQGAQDYLVKGTAVGAMFVRAVRYAMERKEAQRALHRMTAERERMSTLAVIGAGIAHELNNPLMGILNELQWALEKVEPGSRLHQVLTQSVGHTRRCIHIVQNLRAIARAHRQTDDHVAPASLPRALDRALLATRRVAHEAGVVPEVHVEDPLPNVSVEEGLLEQVLVNLVENACDALPREEPRLSIEACRAGGSVVVAVRDNGTGIDPDTQARMFEPFFTTKPCGRGTGLGLTLCDLIVGRSGGRIAVEGSSGEGTTFTLFLPAVEQPAASESLRGGAEECAYS